MDVWIIRDGEKVGPMHDFEVRRRIEQGEYDGATPAWHDGLDGWQPLREIGLFAREFERLEQAAAEPEATAAQPPPLPPGKVRCWRRFWARWFDLSAYAGFWWLGMWAAGQDIAAALVNPWVMFFQFVPWFAVESLLLHYTGTTPGKWLLGLRVVNADGSRLTLGAAVRRSLRVLFIGIGFGWGLLALFCQTLSLLTAKRLGNTLWDHTGGHQVPVAPLSPLRLAALVILFFCALQLQVIVVAPHLMKMAGEQFPAVREEYEKNPPWHLPKRS